MLYFFYPLPSTTPYVVSRSRALVLLLSVLVLVKLVSFYLDLTHTQILDRVSRNSVESEAHSQELLRVLSRNLLSEPNTTSCTQFRECQVSRQISVHRSCAQNSVAEHSAAQSSPVYSGSHRTQYYYSHNLETCSGDGRNLLDSLSLDVATVQVAEAAHGSRQRILYVDNPLVRLYAYFESLRSGLGYFYLGEEIVYKLRDRESSLLTRLYNSYRTRVTLLLGGRDNDNSFDNPIGPTFLEFMVYLTQEGNFKPSIWAPTLQNCQVCDIQYDNIVSRRVELECVDTAYTDYPVSQNTLSYQMKLEIYQQYADLPHWILANLYQTEILVLEDVMMLLSAAELFKL